MKKVLIIGAGIGQVEIAKKIKKLGFFVIVVTTPGNWPAIDIADDVWYIDIYDRDTIVEKAKENEIVAVLSDQNDLTMPTVAYVSEKLCLPGNTYNQIFSYCNKNIFKDNCDKIGIPTVKHIAVSDCDADLSDFDCPFPWIVKPADSQSSIGVKKVNNFSELKPALEKALGYSKIKEAIVEEFFAGDEIVCEGFVENGKYYHLNFGDRKYFNLDNIMIPSQTLFPSRVDDEIKNKILECEEKMSTYINPDFGITHSEYLYDADTKEIRIVETALRGGGVYISSHIMPFSTGIDINDVLINKALGKEVDIQSIFNNKFNTACGYVCFYLEDGTISSINGLDTICTFPFVKMFDLNGIKIGEQTKPMTYKGARNGPILVVGSTRTELEDNIKKVQRTLNIKIQQNCKIIDGIKWE